ncbi:hypothetical protein [Candidatus Lokiarchaeum ossiferum]|uniref:hypothetical protein n=1 Tax=Candidatus Lokiarchaeum ossiferum TaxID=2951803 RepID=UPI00352E21D5
MIPSRLGGAMNPFFQDYNLNRMAIAQGLDEFVDFETFELDPTLRLPENWNLLKNQWKNHIE